MKDCKGTPLEVGQRVVFNFSGSLASGTIIRIVEKWSKEQYRYFTGFVEIQRDSNYEYYKANTNISKIRNLKGIYVL